MSSRILVVDDTPATYGRRAVEAVEAVERVRPDLILLDVMMPEVDGFETCRRLKASAATSAIPVICLTARTETADIVKGFELGAVDYVPKPFNAHELLARVNTRLTMDRLHRENERLLLSILPVSIAARLKSGDAGIADHFPEARVIFADLVNFTNLSGSMLPKLRVSLLDDFVHAIRRPRAPASGREDQELQRYPEAGCDSCGSRPVEFSCPTYNLAEFLTGSTVP